MANTIRRSAAQRRQGRVIPSGRRVLVEALESRRLLSATLFVDASAPGPTHDGSSWADAFTDLQAALGAAAAGTTIKVAQGTYKPTIGTDRDATFQLIDGVKLKGGFAGNTASSIGSRNISGYPTILSGDIGTIGDNSDNSYHVVTGSHTNNTAVLDGFTISGGNGNGNTVNHGAGMINEGGSPTIQNCAFVSNNLGNGVGAGMYNSDSSAVVTNCIFNGNAVSFGAGGAMCNMYSSLVLKGCVFSDNSAIADGGAIYNGYGSATLTHCDFIDNTCGDGVGGAMVNQYMSATSILDCSFTGNSANDLGGALYDVTCAPMALAVTNCIFSGNISKNGGGAVGNNAASPLFSNCTFSANSSSSIGSVMYGIFGSNAVLANCILWGNTAKTGGEINAQSRQSSSPASLTTATFSDIQGGFPGIGNIDADPQFLREKIGNFFLDPTSPCINQGDNAAVPPGVTTDAAGDMRIVGGVVDMGAFEYIGGNIVVSQPTHAVVGGTLVPIVVQLRSALGQLLVNNNSPVTLSIASGPAGAMLGGTTTVLARNGVATFSDISLNLAGNYRLLVSGNRPSARLNRLTVLPAAKLVFAQQPTSENAGLPIPTTIIVDVQDTFGDLVSNDNSTVSLSIFTGPVHVIFGILKVPVVNGQAIFNDVILPTPGTYTLLATDGSLQSGSSSSFTVTPRA